MRVGIVVPIYNVAPYLEQCLDSICRQTFQDCQIVCINDGSTDGSCEIVRRYADGHPQIRLVEQDNAGYGAAVNRGMDLLDTEYFGIIEPDDFLSPFALEHLYQVARGASWPDIVKFAYYDFFERSDGSCEISKSASSQLQPFLYPFRISQYPKLLLYHPSIWTCLYRLDFLRRENIRFVEAPGAGWSDNPFFLATMCKAKTIVWSNECHYYYRRTNPNASSNLKDCSIPLLRALDLLEFLSQEVRDATVRSYVYKRCLGYIDLVTGHQAYSSTAHAPLIEKIIASIPSSILNDNLYTPQEKALYRVFTGKPEV